MTLKTWPLILLPIGFLELPMFKLGSQTGLGLKVSLCLKGILEPLITVEVLKRGTSVGSNLLCTRFDRKSCG